MSIPERIVIIGGGQAAGWAARTLREAGFDGTLSVIADEPHDFYERPPLSKRMLSGSCDAQALQLFDAATLDQLRIDWRRPCRAVAIERGTRQVHLADGTRIGYDRLLIATGSRPHVPEPAWLQLDGVMVLRDIGDALRLRQRLLGARRLAIIGGGWIGLEVAATARSMGVEVSVFERAAQLCGRSVGSEVADALLALHRVHGVDVRLSCGPLQLRQGDAGGIEIDGQCHQVVLVGAGARINLELAQSAGLLTGQGIVVDATGRTSDPAIFAAGDVAEHPQHGVCVQSWAHAQHQATAAARAMLGEDVRYAELPWIWSDQYGQNIQILGLNVPPSQCVVRHEPAGTTYFHLDEHARLQQVVAFNQPRAVKLGRRWMQGRRVLAPAALADPDFDLMRLR